jgi:hypothetical protein
MMAHVTAAALASESKTLSHPASVDSIPTSAGKEDHVSMGPTAAWKAARVVANTGRVLAVELLAACEALDFRRPLRSSEALEAVHARVRRSVPTHGHEGRGAGAPGDLYVDVHVHSHPLFTRQGDNLFCTVPVSFAEAALGARIEVPTPDGPVTLRVPAGVQTGQKLRLSGRGAPSRRADARGDLFIVVKVVTPTVYDDRSRELLRELDRLNPLGSRNPRSSEVSEVTS